MTVIKFHGLLAKKFGSEVKLHLGNFNKVIDAIDSIKNNFKKILFNLEKNGYNYFIFYSKEKKQIEFLPCVIGSGKWGLLIVGAILLVVGIGAALMMGLTFSMLVAGASFGGTFASMVVAQVILAGISTIVNGIITAANWKELKFDQQKLSTGGGAQIASGIGKSYIFSGDQNFKNQGSLIKIGYGKLKLFSNVISTSIKNYDTNSYFLDEINFTNIEELYG